MQILSQRDPKWGNINLGNSNTYIKDYGCLITCLAMIIGTTPDVVNQRLKDVQGFAYGNQVIWAKIPEAFPGITINRVWSYDNDDVKNHVPNVLVEVPPTAIGGVSGKHWVVFIGNQNCNDPWTGSTRPTNDFLKYGPATGYCTISGSWNKPAEPTSPPSPINPNYEKGSGKFDQQVSYYHSVGQLASDGASNYYNNDDVLNLSKKFYESTQNLQNELNQANNKIIELQKQPTITTTTTPTTTTTMPLGDTVAPIKAIINSKWSWYGSNGWKNKLAQLKKLV